MADEYYGSDLYSYKHGSPLFAMLIIVLLVIALIGLTYECGYRKGAYAVKQEYIKAMRDGTQTPTSR